MKLVLVPSPLVSATVLPPVVTRPMEELLLKDPLFLGACAIHALKSGAVGPGFDSIAVLEVIEPLALVGTPISASEDAEAFCSLIDPLPLVDIARYVCQPTLAIGLVIDEIALEAA
eukprot:CAMPEP_0181492380 /NCGR_PEP_ID=MMETSP1110-20121109/50650_1 /TAXON_ID=174948 /ORGANISM="Symbiodinium sp., Strain CCMP421" /LENGTH=115 /DNA_ID=CAMNT_0023619607 /DNA_START=293 /DNA_END=637 /DNA_ORIENTATION=+